MNCPDCGLSILLRLKRQYKFKRRWSARERMLVDE